MANRFHVNLNGVASACSATQGKCPFGGDDAHRSTIEGAREAFEARMGSAFMPTQDASIPGSESESRVSFNDEVNPELLNKISKMIAATADLGATVNDGKLTLFGTKGQVAGMVTEIKAAEAERLADLTRIANHGGKPLSARRQRTKESCRQELLTRFAGQGFKTVKDLAEDERNIADLDLTYTNAHHMRDPENPDGPAVYPYSRVAEYAPHMKGNRGIWVHSEIKLDHNSGDIYTVARVTAPTGEFMGGQASIVKVQNHGQNLSSAIATADRNSEEALAVLKPGAKDSKVSYAPYPYEQFGDRFLAAEENCMANNRARVEASMAGALKDASAWNRVKSNAIQNVTRANITIEEAGYTA